MRCYKAAADGGYAEAQCSLGIKLFLGRGIDQDQQAGLTYLFKAADQQHADTFGLLGHLHAEGHLGEPDRAMALYYFRMAETRGHSEAKRWADDMSGKMTPEERIKTEDLLKRAAEAGRRYELERN
jgi:TPR repeat protein